MANQPRLKRAMPERQLNIKVSRKIGTVDITDLKDLMALCRIIKSDYTAFTPFGADSLRLYDQQRRLITNLDDIPDDYFKKLEDGGLYLSVRVSFEECCSDFFNNLANAVEQDGWLVFTHNIPNTPLSRLYVRESYRSIAKDIQAPAQEFQYPAVTLPNQPIVSKAIVTGTPGTGKSVFLFYLLWQLVKKGKPVVFFLTTDTYYYDGQGGFFELGNPSDFKYLLRMVHSPGDVWCLFDAKNKKEEDLNAVPYSECQFVLSTSPRREMVNDFQKFPTPQVFYMPTWTKNELEAIAPKFPKAGDWESRFEILGGIPRHVLEYTKVDPMLILQRACKQCELNDCIRVVGLDSSITEKSKSVHSLVHITSTFPFTESSVVYASEVALDVIVAAKGLEARRRMRDLLAACEGEPLTAALCGRIFEPYAVDLLERGGNFTCRQLVHGSTKTVPPDTELVIQQSIKVVVDKPESNQTIGQLYVPKTKNYTAIDAWIPGTGALQMTVGRKHDLKNGVNDDLQKLGRGAEKLYWLLPPCNYYVFTKKTPQSIDQYALRIPYPHAEKE